MNTFRKSTQHEKIQLEILSVCQELGIDAIREYKGEDWRADVFIPGDQPIAFEVQISPQSLNRTIERQTKYSRDGILGCWLFEKPISNLNSERPDLPLFYVEESERANLIVNLADRRKVHLNYFISKFLSGNIRFRQIANTNKQQRVKLVFYEMECWKCHTLNNLYYIETPFYSSCNVKIKPEEALWESNNIEYRTEIRELATKFIVNNPELNIKLGDIKRRNSKTVGKSYMSFGCYNCDSIFGDFFVMEAKMEAMYESDKVYCLDEIELTEEFKLQVPHWCLPDDKKFCK